VSLFDARNSRTRLAVKMSTKPLVEVCLETTRGNPDVDVCLPVPLDNPLVDVIRDKINNPVVDVWREIPEKNMKIND
jgi:hypothetical protein